MARTGPLMLHDGTWNGTQVISKAWAKRLLSVVTPVTQIPPPHATGWRTRGESYRGVVIAYESMEFELSDAQVARRIGSGDDREAEDDLCRRMAPRIRLYGLRHLSDAHAAEDLVQQVLITTLEALRAGRVREPEKLASFVLGMCRMTVLDLRRGARRKEQLLERFGTNLLPAAESWMPCLDRDQLTRCVQRLTERDRSVIVMTFYDEKTSADVGSFLGVSEAHVRVIRHRAIHQLRACMEVAG